MNIIDKIIGWFNPLFLHLFAGLNLCIVQMEIPSAQHIGGTHGIDLCIEVVVIRMGRFHGETT